MDTGMIHRLNLPKGREFAGQVEARPLRPEPDLTYCHLETVASLNMRRFRNLEDESREFFAGAGIVLRTISMRPIRYEAVPLGFQYLRRVEP